MKQVIEAIVREFRGSVLAAETTGIWGSLAPENTARPYVTWDYISNAPEQNSDSFEERPLLQFSIWTANDTPDEAYKLFGLLRQIYDNAIFDVDAVHLVSMVRDADRCVRDPDGGWQYSADYRLFVERMKT